jgi:hypothetical protein
LGGVFIAVQFPVDDASADRPCMCVTREGADHDVQSGVFFLSAIEALKGAAVIEGASVVGVDNLMARDRLRVVE